MSKPTIGFCGLTHLGLNSAIAGASKGFPMVCFDQDAELIVRLKQGELPVTEPQLDNLLREHRGNIMFTSDLNDLQKCDVTYVALDVPTDDEGKSDLTGIHALLKIVEPALRRDTVLVVLSQVNPGFTRALDRAVRPIYYQVETLIFGRAVERALFPERYIVGCADPTEPLPAVYRAFLEAHGCPILPMRYESAELAKISINMCLVASVCVANTMAEICENLGADWSEIVPSLRLDRRIGEFSYIAPGLGISGGNLERDLASVIRMGETCETDVGVVRAWINNSLHRKEWPYRALVKAVLNDNPDAKISILGLAYKENTHSTKNSPALVLLNRLGEKKATVFDPIVQADQAGENAIGSSSALEAANGADVVVIMTPWPEFREISAVQLAQAMAGKIIIDPYAMIKGEDARASGLTQITLGV